VSIAVARWRWRERPLGVVATVGRCAAGVVATGACAIAPACVQEKQVLDIELELVEAAAVQGVRERGDLRFSFVTDTGERGQADTTRAEGFALDPQARTLSFEVFVDDEDGGALLALGRTGPVAVSPQDALQADRPVQIKVPVLLAPVDEAGFLITVPPAMGNDVCIATDERGRVLQAGGSTSNQGGYVVEDFSLTGISGINQFKGVTDIGCGLGAGRVALVGGCTVVEDGGVDGDVPTDLVLIEGTRTTVIPVDDIVEDDVPVADLCGARVVPVAAGFWVAFAGQLYFVADGQRAFTQNAPLPVDVLLADAAGNAVVVVGADTAGVAAGAVVVVDPTGAERQVAQDGLLGRRFDAILVLQGDRLIDLEGEVVRDDVDLPGPVRAFTVLSDDRVVALSADGTRLFVSAPDGTTSLVVGNERTAVAALPGDTVLLAGGAVDGVDVIALR
jgi:hypothetical protein